jgi:hypothetical protein
MESNEVFEMTTKDEALRMAIEALWLSREHIKLHQGTNNVVDATDKALNACKEALEQPSQEPVALIFPENRWYIPSPLDKDEKQIEFNRGFAQGFNDCILHVKLHNQKPLYTHPHQWQGLTDDEIEQAILSKNKAGEWWGMCLDIARAIEAKLKEKNHG